MVHSDKTSSATQKIIEDEIKKLLKVISTLYIVTPIMCIHVTNFAI